MRNYFTAWVFAGAVLASLALTGTDATAVPVEPVPRFPEPDPGDDVLGDDPQPVDLSDLLPGDCPWPPGIPFPEFLPCSLPELESIPYPLPPPGPQVRNDLC